MQDYAEDPHKSMCPVILQPKYFKVRFVFELFTSHEREALGLDAAYAKFKAEQRSRKKATAKPRKKSAAKPRKLKSCKPGQVRNPATNRCIKKENLAKKNNG